MPSQPMMQGTRIPDPDFPGGPLQPRKSEEVHGPLDLMPFGAPVVESTHAPDYRAKERLFKKHWEDLGLDIIQPPVRSSSISLLQKCPRKFLYAVRLGLTRGDYAPALETGTTTHELLAELFRGANVENLPKIAAERIAKLREQFLKEADEAGLLPSGKTVHEQITQLEQDTQMALAMVLVWNKYAPVAKLLEHYEVLSIEQTYTVKFPKIWSPITIQPDVVLKAKRNGAIWIVDHKTVGQSVADRAAVLPYELQPRLYLWVFMAVLQAEAEKSGASVPKPGGWIHNLLRKCTLRFCGKDKDHGFEGYVKRVQDWYEEQAELNPQEPPFAQSVIPTQIPVLDEELLLQTYQCGMACRARVDLARFHRNSSACFEYNKACQYLPLCSAKSPKEWNVLMQGYRQEFRDPPVRFLRKAQKAQQLAQQKETLNATPS